MAIYTDKPITTMYYGKTPIVTNIMAQPQPIVERITIDENGIYYAPEGIDGYSAINVQVPPTVDVGEENIKFANSSFSAVNTDIFKFENVTSFLGMFQDCSKLETFTGVPTPKSDTFSNCWENCTNLTTVELDAPRVRQMVKAFSNCTKLNKLTFVRNTMVVNWGYAFENCKSLLTIPENITTFYAENVGGMFQGCTALKSIPTLDFGSVRSITGVMGEGTFNDLTDLGGFLELKPTWVSGFLENCPNLTVQSLVNVLYCLYDWSGNTDGKAELNTGDIYSFGTVHKMSFGTTNLSKLSPEQIAIATNKGWTLI